MKQLTTFFFNSQNNSLSTEVRTRLNKDGSVYFVAKDVCDALDIANASDAVSRLDDDEKGIVKSDTLGGMQEMLCVTESGLYSLIFRSNKPSAKRFRRWVTHEVLPTIRKTGSYSTRKDARELSVFKQEILALLQNGFSGVSEIARQLQEYPTTSKCRHGNKYVSNELNRLAKEGHAQKTARGTFTVVLTIGESNEK